MVISARFASVCPQCNQRITPGSSVNWTKGAAAFHVTCPQPRGNTLDERAASVVKSATATENLTDSTRLLCAIVNGEAPGNSVLAQAALDIIEDKLFAEYEALKASAPNQFAIAAAAAIKKGIYRVSLTGLEYRYGLDYVNIVVAPNEKYQNVKVGEWQGESIGTYRPSNNQFRYWPSTDPSSLRVQTIRRAFEVLLDCADPIEYAKAYAVESSTCWRCGADLVDEKSRERLLGPECFKLASKAS